ncbi:MAG: heparinase II/III family protein, partial [Clostridia bacterium]|nr:heparinase II/III family protein [Clostridia bacterium]
GKPILSLNYFHQKLYHINGDRVKHETAYFERRNRLCFLQLLALKSDDYLLDLEEVLAAICDEFSWIVPAHAYNAQKAIFDRNFIDLFSAETSFYLSETLHVFGDKLSADIQYRIRTCVEEKVIKVYENRTFWWETDRCNWAAVCACGVGLSYLYLFPERFDSVKERLMHSFECYLSGLVEEGYCYEGISYWEYGFGFYALFFGVYSERFGRPPIVDSKKVINALKYPLIAEMDEGLFFPFADGGRGVSCINCLIAGAVKRLYPNQFPVQVKAKEDLFSFTGKALGYRVLLSLEDEPILKKDEEKSVYYKAAQVFAYRSKKYAFAAKGGTNNEFHNHNDVGAFQIVKNQKRLIIDIGAGEYTKDYFNNDKRYTEEIFVCISASHSVPIIDGLQQGFGENYRAENVVASENAFSMDLSKAYDLDTQKVSVRYETLENGVKVHYRFSGVKEKILFRFVSEYKPLQACGGVQIDEMRLACDRNVLPALSARQYAKHNALTDDKFDTVHLIDYEVKEPSGEITFFFEFE